MAGLAWNREAAMYIARQSPINSHLPQVEFDDSQNVGVGDPIGKQFVIFIAVFAIGLACELISPGALATVSFCSDSLNVTG